MRLSHVTGIASGSGFASKGKYQGVAPKSHIISLKILDENGQGNSKQALLGIQWLLDHQEKYNIRIANLSIGSNDKNINIPLLRAVNTAWEHGIVIVAASGNKTANLENTYPPPLSRKIITVGAYEEFTPPPPVADILAPGTDIVSCLSPQYAFRSRNKKLKDVVGRDYIKMSGSSMATPMVSGAIALLLEKYPSLTPDAVKSRLLLCGRQGADGAFLPGLLDLGRLLHTPDSSAANPDKV